MGASRSVVSSAKLIAVCTLLSRVTGLARDILLAQAFGLAWVQDAFSYAFQFPNLFRRLFGEGAMAPVFVPTFTKTLETEGRDAAWRLLARTFALMAVTLTVLIILIALVILVIGVFAPANPAKAEARNLLLSLTALMLPFMLFICLLALLSSILNCVGSFVPAALAPILLNLCMIAGIAWLGPRLYPGQPQKQVYIVALTVLAAGVLQLVAILPALKANGIRLGWRLDTHDPTVRHMLRLLGPVALGQGVLAFGVFLDAQICAMLTHVQDTPATASFFGLAFTYPLSEGALSAVTYAQRLYQFPLGVLVISLATAALPAFSRMAARGEWGAWAAEVRQSLRLAVFEGVLAGAMMIVLAEPLVRLLFQRARFTPEDTVRVGHVVVWYGIGLWAFCAQHIVLRAFYSVGDVRTPLRISMVLLPLNAAMNLLLVWVPGIREAAFAIATTTTAGLSVIVGLLILQRRKCGEVLDGGTLLALGKMVVAGAAAGAAVVLVHPYWMKVAGLAQRPLFTRSIETFGLLALGTGVFLAAAWVLGLHELELLLARRRKKVAAVG
jgi:putative peptidoglycan lipid II flippase